MSIINLLAIALRGLFNGGFQWLFTDTSKISLKNWTLQIKATSKELRKSKGIKWEDVFSLIFGKYNFLDLLLNIVSKLKNILLKCLIHVKICGLYAAEYSLPLKSIFSCNEVNCLLFM